MKKIFSLILMAAFAFTNTTIAADLPEYYPKKGFQYTGRVEAVYAEEGRIVIGDISYQVSSSAVVHTTTSEESSMGRIRPGVLVGFKTGSGRVITEFWVLPPNYDVPRQR